MPIGKTAAHATPAPAATATTSREFRDVPGGKYKLWLNRANVGESKGGTPRVRFGWSVASGEYKGEWVWESCNLNNQTGWDILAKKIHGVCPEFDLPLWWGTWDEEATSNLQLELNDILEFLKANRRSLHACTVKVNERGYSTVFVD